MAKGFFQKKRLKLLAIVLITLFFLFNGLISSSVYIPKIIKTPVVEVWAAPMPKYFGMPQDAVVEQKKKEAQEKTDSSKELGWFQTAFVWFLSWVLYMILKLVSVFLALAGMVLDLAMSFDKFLSMPNVQAGWKISRDFSNMFFVLILLVIGFATIFRIEGYGAKRLLVKLIIAAILVNFSFIISGLIIDSSQVMMKSFRSAIPGSFSAAASNAMGITGQYGNKDSLPEYDQFFKDPTWDAIGSVMKTIAFGVILVFVLLVIAAILIIRLIALWILVILSPFAYLLAILPKTQDLAAKWWQSFLKYCFIGPVMMFFMMLALELGEGANQYTGQYTQGIESRATSYIGLTLGSFLQFMIIVLLLIAGAMSAMWLSIAGAGKVVGGVQGLAKGMGRATGIPRAARATGALARRKAAGTAAAVLSRVPGFRGVGRRMQGAELKRQEKEMEKKSGMYAAMSDKDLTEATQKDVGINRMTAVREAQKRGLFRNAPEEQVERAMATAAKFGDTATLEKIEATRPGLVVNPTRRAKAFSDARRSGEYKKFSGYAFSDNPDEMTRFTNQLGPAAAKKWYDDLEKPEQNAFKQSYLQSRSIAIDPVARENYAKITGDVSPAFQGFPNEAAAFIPKMKIKNITDVKDTPQNFDLLTDHITEGQLTGLAASPDLSGTFAKEIKSRIMAKPMPAGPMGTKVQRLQDIMNANPFWSTV